MPIRPAPMTFRCTQCSWKKRVQPKSDALQLNQGWYACCPQCSSNHIEVTYQQKNRGLLGWLTGRRF